MGTNFYLTSRCDKFSMLFGKYELGSKPFRYKVHIAKTSWGWLPLFERHEGTIATVADIKHLYDTFIPRIKIEDEYGKVYSWAEFEERVLKFNGGVKGAIPETPLLPEKILDTDLPAHIPISHFDCKMTDEEKAKYYKDSSGYEFIRTPFK